jgi:pseudouridine kinase
MKKILVIGATNIDIIGISHLEVISQDSNPGRVQIEFGGVGKNICENLNRLGEEVELVTFIGGGNFGKTIQDYLTQIHIIYDHSYIDELKECGKYVAIHDANGVMISGINDFSLVESVQLPFFQQLHDYINSFDTLVFDTNLSQSVLTYLIQTYQQKMIIVDGVSQTKVKRVQSVLKYIDLLKVNLHELSSLLEKPVDDVILGVKELIAQGLKYAVVTNGKEPITYNIDKRIYQTFIFEPASIQSSVGAGDALLSGIIFGLNHGKSVHEALNYGKKAASFTMEVGQACNPLLTSSVIEEE